jgi:hypothetical protein
MIVCKQFHTENGFKIKCIRDTEIKIKVKLEQQLFEKGSYKKIFRFYGISEKVI